MACSQIKNPIFKVSFLISTKTDTPHRANAFAVDTNVNEALYSHHLDGFSTVMQRFPGQQYGNELIILFTDVLTLSQSWHFSVNGPSPASLPSECPFLYI